MLRIGNLGAELRSCFKKIFGCQKGAKMKRAFVYALALLLCLAIAASAFAGELEDRLISGAGSYDLAPLQALVEKGADVNAKGKDGQTALMAAALAGATDNARFLIKKGALVNAQDNEGRAPLIYAVQSGKANIVELLLDKGADVNAVDDRKGETALMYAACEGDADIVQVLLDGRAEVNAMAKNGETPLECSVLGGYTDAARLLLDGGADMDSKNLALLEAASRGNTDMIELLVSKGADVNAENNDGDSVLKSVVSKNKVNMAVVRLLLDEGADIKSALRYAVCHGKAWVVETMISMGEDMRVRYGDGETALMVAATCGNPHIVGLLLDAGVDINAKNKYGHTALYEAENARYEAKQWGQAWDKEAGVDYDQTIRVLQAEEISFSRTARKSKAFRLSTIPELWSDQGMPYIVHSQ